MDAEQQTSGNPFTRLARAVLQWFDTSKAQTFDAEARRDGADSIDWLRTLPFLLMHVACVFVFVVGWSPVALIVSVALYFMRMFAITGFYHRYFSHSTSRRRASAQFIFGVLGASAVQRGPLWWAAHHRDHHASIPTSQEDVHSPDPARLLASAHRLVPVEEGLRAGSASPCATS